MGASPFKSSEKRERGKKLWIVLTSFVRTLAKEWAVLDRADIGDHYRVIEFKDNAINMFEQKTERKWCNRPFYDEVRLYHNGMLVRLSVNGHEFIF